MPSVAVVILNFNGRNFLEKFLPFVIQYSSPHEVIVADNASTDDSLPFLQVNYPQLRVIKMTTNKGYAGGYNEALAQIKADYYVLLNSDIEVTENWIDPVVQLMEANEQSFAAQPKLRSYYKKDHFEYAGAAGGFMDYLGYPFCRGRIFSTAEKDNGQYNDNREVFWATGACLFVKARLYHELGGLDENFFAHMEEIDLCWRAKNKGYSIHYCGESLVYHVGGGTLNSESPYKTFLNFRNNLLMLHKNLNSAEASAILKKRKGLDLIASMQLFLSGKAKNARAIYDAYKAFKQLKGQYTDQPATSGLMHKEIYTRSIVQEYFMKGKKHFSALSKQQFK